jgi:uncharacterized protein (TIGR02145 family)
MKKAIFSIVLTSSFFACKKDTTTPQTPTTPTTSSSGTITSLDCGNALVTGVLKKGEPATGVSVAILYTGGDGNAYGTQTISSTGVTGLTATLTAGTFTSSNGSLIYTISGTSTSAGIVSFAISIGSKTCELNVTVNDVTQTVGVPGPNIKDTENNTYKTVTIGTQQWMAENLKTTKYNDGTVIPNVTSDTEWSQLITGAWAYYDNDAANNAKYGKLYNWYAVSPTMNGNKNVCPTGWHVPTDAEWTVLTEYLGGASVAGGKMKEVGTTSWNSPNTDATNTSLFSALPGGNRSWGGSSNGIGVTGSWWSSTEDDTSLAWYRVLSGGIGDAGRNNFYKLDGFSVRCLRD